MKRKILALLCVLSVSVVAGVAVAQTANDAKNTKIDEAIALLEDAKAIPADTVTETTTTTVTATVTETVTETPAPPTSTTSSTTPPPTTTTTDPPGEVTVLQGSCPTSFTWDQAHGGCPDARRTTGSGLLTFQNIREDNWEDGWQPVEDPAWSGKATILFRNVYATRIRDDVIENDNFSTGHIEDSLMDGVHTFLSEQCQGGGDCTTTTISPDEDPNIYIDRVLVRLEDPNSDDREGMIFKWQGRGKPEHHPVVTNSVFAISEVPNAGWSKTLLPAGSGPDAATYSNTYLLWLGTGTYGGPKPAGTIFQEGAQARATWCQVRADWLTSHGYAVGTCDTAP